MSDKTDAEIFAELMGEGAIAPAEPTNTTPAPAAPVAETYPDGTPVEPATTPTEPVAAATTPTDPATPSQTPETVPDWVQALPSEARTQYDAMIASNRELETNLSRERQARQAVEGRLAPVQRKLAVLERQIANPPTSPREPVSPTGAAGATPTTTTSTDSFFDSPGWKKFEEEFPEEADVQRKAFQHIETATNTRIQSLEDLLKKTITPKLEQHDQAEDVRRIETEKARLTEMHPDWQEINADPVFVAWVDDWIDKQPDEVRAIYADESKFRRFLTNASFTGNLLTEYKRDLFVAEQYLRQQGGGTTTTTPTEPVTTPAPTPAAPPARATDPLLALSAAPSVRSSPAPRAVDVSKLPDAEAFAAIFEQIGGNR